MLSKYMKLSLLGVFFGSSPAIANSYYCTPDYKVGANQDGVYVFTHKKQYTLTAGSDSWFGMERFDLPNPKDGHAVVTVVSDKATFKYPKWSSPRTYDRVSMINGLFVEKATIENEIQDSLSIWQGDGRARVVRQYLSAGEVNGTLFDCTEI